MYEEGTACGFQMSNFFIMNFLKRLV